MKRRIIVISIITLLLFTGCNSSKINQDKKNAKSEKELRVESKRLENAEKFKNEYESLNNEKSSSGKEYREIEIPSDNPFIYKSAKDVINAMNNKKTFLVYFGFPTCPWCRSVLPTLISVLKDNGVEEIYYVNIKDIRDELELDDKGKVKVKTEGSEEYKTLLEKLDDVLEDYILKDKKDKDVETGEKRIFAPNIVAVIDGKAVKLTTGISDKQDDGYAELTDEIKKDMKESIEKVVREYTTTSASCNIDNPEC